MRLSAAEPDGKHNLLVRYLALGSLTILLSVMIGTNVWMVHTFVGYAEHHPGFWSDRISWDGMYWDIRTIRSLGGVVVTGVDSNTAASKAGLREGDSILAVNGERLRECPQAMVRAFGGGGPGDRIEIEFLRDGRAERRTLVLEENEKFTSPRAYLGVNLGMLPDSGGGEPAAGRVRVTSVVAGGPAERAGIRGGDAIAAINGRRVGDLGGFARQMNALHPGDAVDVGIFRRDTLVAVSVLLGAAAPYGESFFGSRIEGTVAEVEWAFHLPWIISPFVLLVVAAFIGWMKPGDPVAFSCSALFFGWGMTIFQTDLPFLAALPSWFLAALVCCADLSPCLVLLFQIGVLARFPVPTRLGAILRRRSWMLVSLLAVYLLSWCVFDLSRLFFWESSFLTANPVIEACVGFDFGWVALLFALIIASLLVAQRIESRGRPQARYRIIEVGFLIGLVGASLFGVRNYAHAVTPDSWMFLYGFLTWHVPLLLWSAVPVSFAYTILTRRVFGIRFIIRKGLQHLMLSRGAVLLEGLVVLFIVFQVLARGGPMIADSPLALSALSVGSTLAAMFTLRTMNRRLMPAIDRRFFKEAVSTHRVIVGLSQQLSELRDRESILGVPASTLLRSLHPERIIVLLADEAGAEYRPALHVEHGAQAGGEFTAPASGFSAGLPDSVPAGDPVVRRLGGKQQWTTASENAGRGETDPGSVRESRKHGAAPLWMKCELMIGLRGSRGLVGIMALGGKLSEEPYSREERDLLLTIAREMGLALENASLLEVARREAEYAKELQIARSIQQTLFPKELPAVHGWEFAGMCRPAKAVGGDYYDIFQPDPATVVVALGDVSGKGLGASFIMSSVHSAIRTGIEAALARPAGAVRELNRYLYSSTPRQRFVTLFLGVIDLGSGTLRYVNCGHPPPLLIRPGAIAPGLLIRNGPALGMSGGASYTEGESVLQCGDTLLVYSDGVTEAWNGDGEMFGEERLTRSSAGATAAGAGAMIELLAAAVDQFSAGREQADDISILAVRRIGA